MTEIVVGRTGGDFIIGDWVDVQGSPGESLCSAVDRILAAALDTDGGSLTSTLVHATDLSGVRKSFREVAPDVTVGFRSMTYPDLPDVVRWQQSPHASRWFRGHDLDRAKDRYAARIEGTEPTRMWVVEVSGRSIGYLQDYLIGDHPGYAILTAEPDAIGVDYLIGEPSWIGKGIGTRVLWTFLRDVVRPHYSSATTYVACPDHRNAASLRVLEKLGFEQGLWFDEPQSDGSIDTLICCKLDARRIFG